MRVLVVEDQPKLSGLLRKGLTAQGIATDVALDGADAVCMALATAYDVITLDVMLPDQDGFAVCRELRAAGLTTPVLMVTALDTIRDRVTGLDSGADDYLIKPFSFAELLARLRALARRQADLRMPVLRLDDLSLDPAAHVVRRGETVIDLTAKEFALLEVLMKRPGQAVSRFELLESAWDDSYENRSNVVDVYIGYLRHKVDRPFGRDTIQTVRGFGYRLADESGVTTSAQQEPDVAPDVRGE